MNNAILHNKNLQLQYDLLLQSTSNLNFVTHEFLKKLKETSENFANQFLSKKLSREKLAELEESDDATLMIYKDSIIQRFLICYNDTFKFLAMYLDEIFLIKTQNHKQIIQHCLENKIITETEFNKFTKLIQDRDNITKNNDVDISDEVIQYCLMMCKLVRKFKN